MENHRPVGLEPKKNSKDYGRLAVVILLIALLSSLYITKSILETTKVVYVTRVYYAKSKLESDCVTAMYFERDSN
jgi:hypothetical protein